MTFQAVLFDLDGTLLDTVEDIADSANAALRRLGCPAWPAEDYKRFIGDGVANLARRAVPPDRHGPDVLAQFAGLFRDEYAARWDAKTRPYPGVPELLDALARKAVPMAVLSNKPDEFTQLCVRRLLARWRFRAVLGERDGVPRKPDPAGALQVAAALGLAPREVLYLGDTGTDMQTAAAAGMCPVGALWGFRTDEELSAHGAKTLIERPPELLSLLDGAIPLA